MAKSGWEKAVNEVQHVVLGSLKPLENDFGFQLEKAEVHFDTFPLVTAKHQHTFLEVEWCPRDGFSYYLGPLVRQKIPEHVLGPFSPRRKIRRYEIAWFSELNKEVMPMVRAKSGPIAEAVPNAIAYLIRHASDFLRGDWVRRPALDALIKSRRKTNAALTFIPARR